MKVYRTLRLAKATGQIRTATFQEREHIVVPVVALVEGVIWPVNAPYPELVLAEEFSRNVATWNGRPVVADHPERDGKKVSANSPDILETQSFGMTFNAAIDNDKLTMEAWLDPLKAEKVGSDAVRVCERAKNNEDIEISVGAFMHLEEIKGFRDGKEYQGIWRDISSDHLAMLPEGMVGACSNEMGCGAPRAASLHLVTAAGLQPLYSPLPTPEQPMSLPATAEIPKRSLAERLRSLLGFRDNKAADMSGRKIEDALSRAAVETVPGFMWVHDYWPDKGEAVFASMTADHDLKLMRGTYKLSDDEKATIDADSLTEVVEKKVYEVAAAADGTGTQQRTAACGCQSKQGDNMTREARVAALIASGKFNEEDKTWLNQVPETHLTTLEAAAPAAAVTTPAAPAPAVAPQQPVAAAAAPAAAPAIIAGASPQTEEQFLSTAPPSIQESLRQGLQMVAAQRSTIIDAIVATGRGGFTKENLQSRTLDELRSLQALAAVEITPVTYEGLGAPVHRAAAAPQAIPEPPALVETK